MKPTTPATTPKLRFVGEFTQQDAFEAKDRGYLSHVLVELNGSLYPVLFYDPTRLQQDLTDQERSGHPFVADPGMIVVPEINRDTMEDVIGRLVAEGFFEHITPVSEEDLACGNAYCWPPEIGRKPARSARVS